MLISYYESLCWMEETSGSDNKSTNSFADDRKFRLLYLKIIFF